MSLAAWFRRHRNVFSISAREVEAEPGDEDVLVEDYGERATEARRPAGYGTRFRGTGYDIRSALEISEDEVADGEPPPDSRS